jgi:hypothetical protein
MKFLMGVPLLIGGIYGIAVGFVGNVTVAFPYIHPQAIELSIIVGIFGIITLLSGAYMMFVSD